VAIYGCCKIYPSARYILIYIYSWLLSVGVLTGPDQSGPALCLTFCHVYYSVVCALSESTRVFFNVFSSIRWATTTNVSSAQIRTSHDQSDESHCAPEESKLMRHSLPCHQLSSVFQPRVLHRCTSPMCCIRHRGDHGRRSSSIYF